MKNKSVSDFVAATMDAVLNSQEHKSLFSGTYKYASADEDSNHAKVMNKPCKTCKQKEDMCMCAGGYMADDGMTDDSMSDSDMSWDAEDGMPAMSHSMPEEMASTAAFDVAIDGLLTASAALDAIGMTHSSTASLKLASLVVEAKKVVKKDSKKKKSAPKGKLTSKDFKKMHEEDDDGKLTAANFKKMLKSKK
jgi:hypothetical protein